MSKLKIHLAIGQFEFIEKEVDTIEEARELTDEVKRAFSDSEQGLTSKEFNKALDRYLTDGTGETEIYISMNTQQRYVFQEIKKSMKRLGK